jgi:hypothetical protein
MCRLIYIGKSRAIPAKMLNIIWASEKIPQNTGGMQKNKVDLLTLKLTNRCRAPEYL